MALLEVEGLTRHFHLRRSLFDRVLGGGADHVIKAVEGVSFTLDSGEILGIAGESGCGKSTTCLMITKLLEPSAGSIRFKGADIRGLKGQTLRDYRRQVQIIFQDPYESLNPRFTVFDLVAEAPRALGLWDEAETEERVLRTLGLVGLKPEAYKDRFPHEMSGGERQRVGIASALVVEPELVIADEPLSMLDVSIRAGILDLIRDLSERLHFSCIYVSHDLSILANITQRLMIMYLGQVMELGPVRQVVTSPLHPYAAALIAAVPVPDPRVKRPVPKISGDVSQPIDPPPGCRFQARCPLVIDRCRAETPPLRELRPEQWVSCHRAE